MALSKKDWTRLQKVHAEMLTALGNEICTDCGLPITRNKTCVECGASVCHRREYCDICGEPLPVWSTNPDRYLAMQEDQRGGWADYS